MPERLGGSGLRAGRAAAALLLPIALFSLQVPAWSHAVSVGLDDAFIGFIYSRNLAEHGQPTWNVGGEHVEGYTHFLWMVLMAGVHAAGLPITQSAKAMGCLSVLGLLWVLGRMERVLAPSSSGLAVRAAVLSAAAPALPLYAVSGIETTLFALLVAAGAAAHVLAPHRPFAGGLLFGLAALTRPEGALFFAVSAGHRVLERAGIRDVALRAAGFALLVAPHAAFRRAYYGRWLPNSFHVKAGGFDHGEQWRNGWTSLERYWGGPGAFVLAAVGVAILLHRPWGRAKVYLLLTAVAHALYVCSIGFDFMDKHRHQVMGFPFAMMLAAMGMSRLEELAARVRPALGTAAAVLLLVAGAGSRWDRDTRAIDFHTSGGLPPYDIRVEIGLHLGATTEPGDLIATGECGKIPYVARRPSMDLSGINDLEIGRRRPYAEKKPAPLPLDLILARRPAVVLLPSFQLGLSREPLEDPLRLSGTPTFREPTFLAAYELRHERVRDLHFYVFRRRP